MPDKLSKIKKALEKEGFRGVECREWRRSIILEGEMGNWGDIVKAGKVAAKFGYKGVVNEISLKDFKAPPIKKPNITDLEIDKRQPDVLIIGGGVIGCSIARELSKYKLDILLVDKESDVAMHASSRNDGMIHPGIAASSRKLKSKMNVKGNAMYTQLCKELGIPFERYGNLILYSDQIFGIGANEVFKRRAKKLGINDWSKVTVEQLKEMEPNVTDKAIGAFSFPSSGVLSPYKLTVALAENAVENGAQVCLDTIVLSMDMKGSKINSVKTNRGTVHPKVVINAAGVYSDVIAAMADDKFFSIHPRKGECVILDKKKGPMVTRSMGLVNIKVLDSTSKGGGVMRTIDQNVLVGPDAYEQPLREDFCTHKENIDAVMKKHLPLIKGLTPADVITYFSGIRASNYEEDFIIERSDYVDNLVHAASIQSPGLASAPAIAEEISRITVEALSTYMQVLKNERFNPYRQQKPHLNDLDFDEKQKVIKENPDYGVIVCRCEEISKGEIIDAVNSPVPATSIDAIKRRVRPGMGRCQGGFCSPLVTAIICEQTGMTPDQVTKSGGNSNLLTGKTSKGGAVNEEI